MRLATLSGAVLRRANLIYANLSEADLHGADLRLAVLIGAHLTKIDLGGTNLVGTQF